MSRLSPSGTSSPSRRARSTDSCPNGRPVSGSPAKKCAAHSDPRDSAEQPLVAQLAGDLDRLFSKLPCRGDVNEASDARGGDQRRGEQRGVGAGVGPPEHRHEQPEGLLQPGTGPPVAVERDAQAQHHRGPVRAAGRVPGGAPQVGLIGVQPGQPFALLRPGQISGRRLGDGQEMRAVRRGGRGGLVRRRPRRAARRRTAGWSPAAGTAGLPRRARPRPGSCPPATRADPRHPARRCRRTRTPPRPRPGRSRRRTPTGAPAAPARRRSAANRTSRPSPAASAGVPGRCGCPR